MENEIEIEKYKKNNRKIITLYRILSYDLLFYYTISYLFLVNIKNLSTAQIIFADSFYPLFKLLFQIPCTLLIQKIGKRNSLIASNIAVVIYIILTIGLINTFTLIISNIFLAFAFVVKSMAESNLLYDSLENTSNKHEIFSKYESKSASGYFFLDAITSLFTGFLYVVNPYLPLYICLLVCVITVILSFCLKEIPTSLSEKIKNSNTTLIKSIKVYLKDLTQAFKFIFKSGRLRSLILYNSLLAGLITLMVTLRRSLLNDVNVSSEYFGIIFTILGIIASISSSQSFAIHKKYTNKTLTVLGLNFTFSIIISGAVVILKLPLFLMYYLLLIMFAIQYIIKGPFYTLIRQYLNSFCDSNMRLKIYSANAFIEYLSSTLLSILCSFILNYYSNAVTTLILGTISTIVLLILLSYMSHKVGLKPDEYPKKDIIFNEVE